MSAGDRHLPKWRIGQALRARTLNEHIEQTNQLTSQIRPPRQIDGPPVDPASDEESREESELQDSEAVVASDGVSLLADEWVEVGREISIVRIFQVLEDNTIVPENFVDVERVESITFDAPGVNGGRRYVRLSLRNRPNQGN